MAIGMIAVVVCGWVVVVILVGRLGWRWWMEVMLVVNVGVINWSLGLVESDGGGR